jgi:predicted nucleotidyltransferase
MRLKREPFHKNSSKLKKGKFFNKSDLVSICYHDIFNYPLTFKDLKRWSAGKVSTKKYGKIAINISELNDYMFISGRKKIVQRRLINEKYSSSKMKLVRKYGHIIGRHPFVKMVALTGALAMNSSSKNSDIDLLIVTRENTLWLTRGMVWLLLKVLTIPVRKPQDKVEKDRLCLNIWLDETSLVWQKNERNIYTAHEILQTTPIVNKDNSYEKFISENKWVGEYWLYKTIKPIKIVNHSSLIQKTTSLVLKLLNSFVFSFQKAYMSARVTRETVSSKRALFHPNDMSTYVLERLKIYTH